MCLGYIFEEKEIEQTAYLQRFALFLVIYRKMPAAGLEPYEISLQSLILKGFQFYRG